MDGTDVLKRVEAHLVREFGPEMGRAEITFLGAEPIEVLRFGPAGDGVVRYATLGMSRAPMSDPASPVLDPAGPRAELVLSLKDHRDSVARRLALLAAIPAVEGVPVVAGAGLDLGEPLWDGARFTAVLVAEPGGLLPDLPLAGPTPVRFLPVLPMTPNESAFKRVHGATELQQRWLAAGTDLRDPDRAGLRLDTGGR
ncbi:suppressor of fused domain protein [Frankia sp. Cppng1_Ct_nod]|uniref:suppressor of fused domain protein n=1 Tax=Frankia sp. Cppng1_Ct_nod TaxID=2897162 RepID=UPI00202587D1|nr:suppressor of fused domain protein [Frankia sp. Cppng1_Ct_nod]